MGQTALIKTSQSGGDLAELQCQGSDASFLCEFPKSGRKACLPPHTQRLAPRTSICILPTLYKRSQSPAPSEDKAVIQPGSCDIPALRVQLGQFMNSAGSQGEVDPVL